MKKKAFLLILDGYGHSPDPGVSAIDAARKPFIDSLYKRYPNAELTTHGKAVGLPEGQMGNSEVGHLNLGAGRIVYQELARINNEIANGAIAERKPLKALIEYCISHKKPVHLMGLLSDGGVHSHIDHIIYLSNLLTAHGIRSYIHAFLDGRDTDPESGVKFLQKLIRDTDQQRSTLSSVIGRYYAMDRDQRWERIAKAWKLLVKGEGEKTDDIIQAVNYNYQQGITDEFMGPIKLNAADDGVIREGDAVLFANFRTDRPRQLTAALTQQSFDEHNMKPLELYYLTMTQYDEEFEGLKVIYEKENLQQTLGEVLSANGLTQLRIAETEKYPHVTFFFSGGREEAFAGEKRILVSSPKVATYDLQPEMSAGEVTSEVVGAIRNDSPDFIILNYANADMVGHTGIFGAAVTAVETLDKCLSEVIPVATEAGYFVLIIADHGNSDCMINPDGSANTAHTINPVPVIAIDPLNNIRSLRNGKLADVAPTLLNYLGIEIPSVMTGDIIAEM